MNGLDLILTRRSPLSLRPPGPDEATLRAMLAAATCGPDHGKLEPWRFVVIEGEGRQAFGRILADSLRRRLAAVDEAMIAREEAKALRAPMIVVVAAQTRECSSVPAIEQVIAVGIAAYNLLLAAHASGFAGMWRTGASAYDPEVRQALGFDALASVVGFLYVGMPDTMRRPRPEADHAACARRWPAAETS